MIALAWDLANLGVGGLELELNVWVRRRTGRITTSVVRAALWALDADSQARLSTNPLRILIPNKETQALLEDAPPLPMHCLMPVVSVSKRCRVRYLGFPSA